MRPEGQLHLVRGPEHCVWPVVLARRLVQPLRHRVDVVDKLQVLLCGVVDALDVRDGHEALVGHEGGALRAGGRQECCKREKINSSPFGTSVDLPKRSYLTLINSFSQN